MFLFTILALILVFITLFVVLTISAIGATGIILCGDVIVCAIFIILLIRFLWRRRR
jgi:hypothetical protein